MPGTYELRILAAPCPNHSLKTEAPSFEQIYDNIHVDENRPQKGKDNTSQRTPRSIVEPARSVIKIRASGRYGGDRIGHGGWSAT